MVIFKLNKRKLWVLSINPAYICSLHFQRMSIQNISEGQFVLSFNATASWWGPLFFPLLLSQQ